MILNSLLEAYDISGYVQFVHTQQAASGYVRIMQLKYWLDHNCVVGSTQFCISIIMFY